MTERSERLFDAVNEITRPHRLELHGRSMLAHLQADVDADEDSSPKTGSAAASGGFESRPPGHYAPRELLSSMEHEVRIWIGWLGFEERGDQYGTSCTQHCAWTEQQILQVFLDQHLDLRYQSPCTCQPRLVTPALQANLGQIVGIAAELDDDLVREITRDIEKIAGALRRYCGLERIFRPRTTCPDPDCGKTGSVTIWLDDQGTRAERARCHACSRAWDSTQVGLLVEHIRAETDRPRQSNLAGYQRLAQTLGSNAA